jgi:hypothetical protein
MGLNSRVSHPASQVLQRGASDPIAVLAPGATSAPAAAALCDDVKDNEVETPARVARSTEAGRHLVEGLGPR